MKNAIHDVATGAFNGTHADGAAAATAPTRAGRARVVTREGEPWALVRDGDGAPRLLRFLEVGLAAWKGRDILPGIRPEAITDPEGADRMSASMQRLTNRGLVGEPAGSDRFVTMLPGGGT